MLPSKKNNRSYGFTLIELLTVTGVLSLLITTLFVYINPKLQFDKAQDSRRSQDLDQIKKALDLFYNDHGYYPSSLSFGQKWTDTANTRTIYMESVPNDPDSSKSYVYKAQPASGAARPQWYVLFAKTSAPPNTTTACRIDPDPFNVNCMPDDYNSDYGKYVCKTSGNVDCATSSIAGGGGGSTLKTVYFDGDRDGYATLDALNSPQQLPSCPATGTSTYTCRRPTTSSFDCNDGDSSIRLPTIQTYKDSDDDHYADGNTVELACSEPLPSHLYLANPPSPTPAWITGFNDCAPSDASAAQTRQLYGNLDNDDAAIGGPYFSKTANASACTVPYPTPIPPGLVAGYSTTAGTDCNDGIKTVWQDKTCANSNGAGGVFSNQCVGTTCESANYFSSCSTGLSACNGTLIQPTPGVGATCRNLQTDSNNCGTCGNTCSSGAECVNGTCTLFPENGLIAYLSMDDIGNPTSALGSYTITPTNITRTTDAKLGAASRSFAAGSTLLTSPFTAPDMSVSFWVKTTDTNGFLLSDTVSVFFCNNSFSWSNSCTAYVFGAVSNFNNGLWHHIVATKRNLGTGTTERTVYFDGQPLAGKPTIVVNNNQTLALSTSSSSNSLVGLYDEVGVWNRVLSANEVTRIYNSGQGTPFLSSSACYSNSLQSDTNNCGACANSCDSSGLTCGSGVCGGPDGFVTVPTGNSLTARMTGYTTNSTGCSQCRVTDSGYYSQDSAYGWKAFNRATGGLAYWYTYTQPGEKFVTFDFGPGNAKTATRVTLKALLLSGPGSASIKNWKLYGSQDNVSFTLLKTGIHPNDSTNAYYYNFQNITAYRYYKAVVDNNYYGTGSVSTNSGGIDEMELQ